MNIYGLNFSNAGASPATRTALPLVANKDSQQKVFLCFKPENNPQGAKQRDKHQKTIKMQKARNPVCLRAF